MAYKRTPHSQRRVEMYAYAKMSVPTRRKVERAESRARAKKIYDDMYARKRARSGNVLSPAPAPTPRADREPLPHFGEQFHDDQFSDDSYGELAIEAPRHDILWRWLLRALAPDAPDAAFGHWLSLARRWDYLPSAAELLRKGTA
jgi:hypothetical protein